MTIAIDVSSIVYGTGVSVYTQELVKALSEIDKQNQYILFAGSLRQSGELRKWFEESNLGSNFKLKIFPLSPKLQTKIWNDWHIMPLEWLIGQHDVYHSVDWSLAPSKAKTLITVHDLFFLKRPDLQQHPYKQTLERRLRLAKDKNLPAIAVSTATKNDLIELISYPDNLITVIYEAANSDFKPLDNPQQLKNILSKYDLSSNYLLMASTLEPRKNLKRTLEAFSHLPKTHQVELAIAGKVGWGEQIQPVENVKLLGYVPTEDLKIIFAGARGILYPSIYEGFGINILVAMSSGVPLLTSNISSMPEVAGDAAIYVDPYDANSIRSGIQNLLSLKPAQRKQLIEKGFKQLKKFSWQKAAKETLKVYQSL